MTTTHKTTHTPGPWAVAYDSQDGPAESIVADRHVCTLTYADRRSDADARLIAAAPTMFDALKEIEGGLEDLAIHLNTTSMDRYIKQARAIIERIEGQDA